MKLYLNENVTLTVDRKFIARSLGLNLTNSQKVKTAIEMAEYYGKTIDMSYIEDLLVETAKTRLKSIKKDKALYHRNRQYFNALKTITKIKSAD